MSNKSVIDKFEHRLMKLKVLDEIVSSKSFLNVKPKSKGEKRSPLQKRVEKEVEAEIRKFAEKLISVLSNERVQEGVVETNEAQETAKKPTKTNTQNTPQSQSDASGLVNQYRTLLTSFSVYPEKLRSVFPADEKIQIVSISEADNTACIKNVHGQTATTSLDDIDL